MPEIGRVQNTILEDLDDQVLVRSPFPGFKVFKVPRINRAGAKETLNILIKLTTQQGRTPIKPAHTDSISQSPSPPPVY